MIDETSGEGPSVSVDDSRREMEELDAIARQIFATTRQGVVGGVEFDLRHRALDPTLWVPARNWLLSGGSAGWPGDGWGPATEGPWLIFPWADPDLRKQVSKSSLETLVEAGDHIRVEFVENVPMGGELSHPADSHVYAAKLIIDRANGRRVRPNRALWFYHRRSLLDVGARGFFEIIAARLCDEMGVTSLDDLNPPPNASIATRRSRVRRWRLDTLDANRRLLWREAGFKGAQEVRDSMLNDARDAYDNYKVERIVDRAVAVGYYAACAEATAFMSRPALVGRNRSSGSKRGGKKGGETRARKAEIWQKIASELIHETVRKHGLHKREAILEYVKERWPVGGVRTPGRSSVLNLLRRMERAGDIATQI